MERFDIFAALFIREVADNHGTDGMDIAKTNRIPDADRVLIQRIAAGDTEAMGILYERYSLKLQSYLIGILSDHALAEDVLQDVMLTVWHNAVRFRGDSSVLTWLLTIARHRALKVQGRQKVFASSLNDSTAAADPSPGELVEQAAEQKQLVAALHKLPVEQRETLELLFFHELSGVETAEVLGVAPGTIKSRLHRALITMRRVLSMEGIHRG